MVAIKNKRSSYDLISLKMKMKANLEHKPLNFFIMLDKATNFHVQIHGGEKRERGISIVMMIGFHFLMV